LNRLTRISFADGKVVTYQYDQGTNGIGRLTTMTDASGSTTWTYDQYGDVLTQRQQTGSVTLTTTLTYNVAGRLASITYPSGRVVTVSYNMDQILELDTTGGATLARSVTYQPFGRVASWVAAGGNSYTRSFDQDGRIAGVSVTPGTPFTAMLTYDAAGRITGISDTVLPSKSFGYDAVDRIVSYQTNSVTQSYTYDADGNRLSMTSNGTTSYSYNGTSNRLLGSSGAVTSTLGYDAAGNLLSNASATNYSYAYDASGRMVTESTGSNVTNYTLNGFGQRVTKSGYGARSIAGGSEIFVYDTAGRLLGEYDAAGHVVQETAWLDNLPIATMTSSQVYTIYPDHLGAPRAIGSSGYNLVWTWDHDPFGNGQPTGSITYNLRLPGQYYDNESGLHYNYFRDYDPATGRYVESDPIGLNGGINTYTYVYGNPVGLRDPRGLCDSSFDKLKSLFDANPYLLPLILATEVLGGGPEDPLADAAVAWEIAAAEAQAEGRAVSLLIDTADAGAVEANFSINVSASEAETNLISNGYSVVQRTDSATILYNGQNYYTIYTRSSTGLPGLQSNNISTGTIIKYRLSGP